MWRTVERALTYFLLEALGGNSGLNQPLRKGVKTVVGELCDSGYGQEPQLRESPAITKQSFPQDLRVRAFNRAVRRGTVMMDVTMNLDSQKVVRELIGGVQQQIADAIWEANDEVHGRGCDVSVSASTAGSGSISGTVTCHF